MRFIFFGVGAIGGCVGAWVASHYKDCYFYDQESIRNILKQKGLTVYLGGNKKSTLEHIDVQVIDKLDNISADDVIVLGVKNYSLPDVAKFIRNAIGNVSEEPIILSMANGIKNQEILPKLFKRVIYCVIGFNAWVDEPCINGYQSRGPLIIGTPDNSMKSEIKQIHDILNLGVETISTDRFQDAVYCKLVLNLTNSITTLIGLNYKDYQVDDMRLYKEIVSRTLWEGVEILKTAGFHEFHIGDMPSWNLLKLSKTLPYFIAKGMFKKKIKKMVLSSMAQDILVNKRKTNELDDINGVLIDLANKYNLKVPYNRAIYTLCKEKFENPEHFIPIKLSEIAQFIEKEKVK